MINSSHQHSTTTWAEKSSNSNCNFLYNDLIPFPSSPPPSLSLSLPSFPSLSSSSLFSGTKLLLNSKKGSGSALTSEVRDRAPVAKANFVVKTRHLMARIMFFLVPLSRFGFWKGKHMPPLHLPVVSLSTVLYGDGLAITRSWVQTTSVATAYRHQLSMPSL